MMEEKGKSRDKYSSKQRKVGEFKNGKRKTYGDGKKKIGDANKKRDWRGPRLPNAFHKEIELCNQSMEGDHSDGDAEIPLNDDVSLDVYEYEEAVPQEELQRNRRFDPVKNYQYELPEDFEDENVPSDEGEAEDEEEDEDSNKEGDNGNEAYGRHVRMLQEITGLPGDAFAGKKKKDFIVSEAYPESEFNPSRDILDGDGRISIQDLVEPLHGKFGFSKLRKSLHRIEKKSAPVITPLAKVDQERLERKAAYKQSKKDMTKWEPLVKKNREAPTLYFDKGVNLGYSTIGSIASEFVPRTEFEKKIAVLVNHNEVVEAHKNDGARLLELNEISVADLKDQQDRLAKMRALLFRHEIKAKRIKKIKSKHYHRLLKKDRTKAAEAAINLDPGAAKELAEKQDKKRAEERITLKHKNHSKWASRILKRGLDIQDDGTRAAFAEQLNIHASLTRKMRSMKDSSSSDGSSYEEDSDDMSEGSDPDRESKLLMKAKEATHNLLKEDEEYPQTGVFSLPFMKRGMEKRKEAIDEEANLALKEYELALEQLENKNEPGNPDPDVSNGRRVFGARKEAIPRMNNKSKVDNYYGDSDSENDVEEREDGFIESEKSHLTLRESNVDPSILREEFESKHDSVFKSLKDHVEDPDLKSTIDVAFFASNRWTKIKTSLGNEEDEVHNDNNGISSETAGSLKQQPDVEGNRIDSDTDSGGEMVDGILLSASKSTYELPSQTELIQRAFAGDNVEEDFEKDKEEVLNEENPLPEKPVLLPGWGQWTDVQKKKGVPSWMLKEHETAKKKREESLKKRKDAGLKHVIISERLDKKAEKLHTKLLPYPYTSQEVFEQSIRMPIGPEFNPVSAVGSLNRPEVVKKAGVIIKPIKFKDISIGEKAAIHEHHETKRQRAKDKTRPKK